jgi:hypothetical protein
MSGTFVTRSEVDQLRAEVATLKHKVSVLYWVLVVCLTAGTCANLSAQGVGIASIGPVGDGCGLLQGIPTPMVLPARPLETFPVRQRVAVWMYAPHFDSFHPERWLVFGDSLAMPAFHGVCRIWVDPFTAGYFRYPEDDWSTAAYFVLPADPIWIGREQTLQGFIKIGPRVDISRALRITFGPGEDE